MNIHKIEIDKTEPRYYYPFGLTMAGISWGSFIRNYFLPGENIKDPKITIEQSKAMVYGHKAFLESWLKTLPQNTITNYKSEVEKRLGIILNVK